MHLSEDQASERLVACLWRVLRDDQTQRVDLSAVSPFREVVSDLDSGSSAVWIPGGPWYERLRLLVRTMVDGSELNFGASAPGGAVECCIDGLLDRARAKGPRQAATDWRAFQRANGSPGLAIQALAGIRVDEPFEVSPGTMLMPLDRLPRSWARDELAKLRGLVEGAGGISASAALVRRVKLSPSFLHDVDTDSRAQAAWQVSRDHVLQQFEALRELTWWFSIIGPSSPVPVARWWQLEPWIPIGRAKSSSRGSLIESHGGTLRELDLTLPKTRKELLDLVTMLATVADRPCVRRLALGVRRLNRAMRQADPVDEAVDLGIAAECIFEIGRHDPKAHGIALRSAWLLGSDVRSRREVSAHFKKLYGRRSMAVHSGRLWEEKENNDAAKLRQKLESVRALFRTSRDYLADAVWKLLEREHANDPIDWDELVFG